MVCPKIGPAALGLLDLAELGNQTLILEEAALVTLGIALVGVAERNLPSPLRCAISAESGFNDGLALPFVVLPVLVLTEPPGEVLGHWLARTVL